MTDRELDVRPLRKSDKHPTIFAAYAELTIGESVVLINDHEPKHLRDEFMTDHAGSHQWDYLETGPTQWRIRITKLASTPLPRVLANTADLVSDADTPDAAGAVWKLQIKDRDLDSNVVALPPGGTIDAHAGPELDLLIHVLSGSGRLVSELETLDLGAGALLWLPRRSRRQFVAGPNGLRYLTVHQRRRALVIQSRS
jgi:uncharacterized protein (DUF2249 family)/quercetin dioxygenase-like cupin family protein